jgi:predicted amidohydrolase YtcJ
MTDYSVDLVLHGGTIIAMVEPFVETLAIAVRDGRVVAVGDKALAARGRAKEVRDLDGLCAIPGLQDAHVHPVMAGTDLLGCHLQDCTSADQYAPALRSWLDSNPAEEWLVATGWHTTHFPNDRPPAAADLDRVSTERPIFFRNADGHSAWLNSAALGAAGITTAADPPGGRIERDQHGEPTGLLHDGAMELVTRKLPPPTTETRLQGLLLAQQHLHAFGITGWQDALVGPALGLPDPEQAYLLAAEQGLLTARVAGALRWDPDRGPEQVEELVSRRSATTRPNYVPTNVKFFIDGVPEAGTSALLAPYCCAGPAGQDFGVGPTYYEPGYLNSVVTRLDAAGFGVHFHALGDRSLKDSLNAIEAARRANGLSEFRHQVAHVYLCDDEDLRRFAALGVIANLQLYWASGGEQATSIEPFIGPRRARRQFPFRDLLQHGAALAAGSDWPVTSPNPWHAMHVAVHRLLPGLDDEPLVPDQAITPAAALNAYTRGSALANGDRAGGLLVVGARADIAILDRHPLRGPDQDLGSVTTVAAYAAGRSVFEQSDSTPRARWLVK